MNAQELHLFLRKKGVLARYFGTQVPCRLFPVALSQLHDECLAALTTV